MEELIFNFCVNKYNDIYKDTKERLEAEAIASSRNHLITDTRE